MNRIALKASAAAGALALYLANAAGALAQLDYTYDYTYDTGGGAAGFLVIAMWCCGALLGLGMFVFNIWMLIHVLQHGPDDQKILWLLLILFVPFGSVIYFFAKKKEFEGAGG